MKNGRRIDIVADIISVTGRGARRTKTMYFANLSDSLLRKYFADSVHARLLQLVGEEFLATSRDQDFLDSHQRFNGKYSRMSVNLKVLQRQAEEIDLLFRSRRNDRGIKRSGLAILG